MTRLEVLETALQRAAATSAFIQGEVLDVPDACVVLADASAPLTSTTLDWAETEGVTSGLVVVPHAVDRVVVLTQTCDLQVTTPTECFCLVAPVMQVEPELAYQALRGRRPSLVALPWVDDQSVADLSRITTVERSVLLGVIGSSRPRDSRERLHFAETVSRYLTRPALRDDINELLSPFVKRIAEKHDRDSPEGRCAHRVSELRLEATPDFDHPTPALNVLMVLEEEHLPTLLDGQSVEHERIDALRSQGLHGSAVAVEAARGPIAIREAWIALAECWLQPAVDRALAVPGVGSLEITVMNGTEFSYARSRHAPRLDVRYLSTRTV